MQEQLKLSELNLLIRKSLQESFPASLWIIAEISELKVNRSGHCYLELVEQEGEEIIARARATIWSYTFRMLKPYFETTTGKLFTQGIKILVNATVEFHPAYGLSLNIRDIDPAYTLGDVALQRQKILKRLRDEGIIDMNRELPLPLVPQRIAVISSSSAAGYQDFMDQLQTNPYGYRFFVTLFESGMQGDEAVVSILRAFDHIFEDEEQFDCVVIIRGGGAAADLSCFDNYDLACTVAQFSLPVFTGIGHEKDDTIVDRVAHTRLKTPTAVAEFLIQGVKRFSAYLNEKAREILEHSSQISGREEGRLIRLISKFNIAGQQFFSEKSTQMVHVGSKFQGLIAKYSFNRNSELDRIKNSFLLVLKMFIQAKKGHTEFMIQELNVLTNKLIIRGEELNKTNREKLVRLSGDRIAKDGLKLKGLAKMLTLLTPENILKRGFTLTMKEGKVIKKAGNLDLGDEIQTLFSDGTVSSKITEKT